MVTCFVNIHYLQKESIFLVSNGYQPHQEHYAHSLLAQFVQSPLSLDSLVLLFRTFLLLVYPVLLRHSLRVSGGRQPHPATTGCHPHAGIRWHHVHPGAVMLVSASFIRSRAKAYRRTIWRTYSSSSRWRIRRKLWSSGMVKASHCVDNSKNSLATHCFFCKEFLPVV